jgi:hypothetical protein
MLAFEKRLQTKLQGQLDGLTGRARGSDYHDPAGRGLGSTESLGIGREKVVANAPGGIHDFKIPRVTRLLACWTISKGTKTDRVLTLSGNCAGTATEYWRLRRSAGKPTAHSPRTTSAGRRNGVEI